ncbi:reticulon-1-A-like isoform X2 [Leptotrombidium deliense]|uniref:Reticulon-like protein n=1 Tax=Leptotrombidium deliense TaxID=299467 RepID=A0A443SIQ8_9ACAR|nr:reticulon-1-A-like isoform X2 [Leptotrombidium deliense]
MKLGDLVYWKDVKKSGVVFGVGLVLLLSFACCSIISVIAYSSLAVLLGTFSFRVYKNILQAVQKTSEGHPFDEYLKWEVQPSKEKVHEFVDIILEHFNQTVVKLRDLFLVQDIFDSIKFGVFLWSLTYIGAWFNGITVLILAFISVFSLPKLYEMNKTQVDQYLQLACTHIQELISTVKAKIPFPAARKDKSQ